MRIWILLLFLQCLTLSTFADAYWVPSSQKGMINQSNAIVIVEFISSKKTGPKLQVAKFKVHTIVKWDKKISKPKLIEVKSLSNESTGPPRYFFKNKKGDKLLLFLCRTKAGLQICNGSSGALPIKGNNVYWQDKLNHDRSWIRFETPAKPVLTDISDVVKIIQNQKTENP